MRQFLNRRIRLVLLGAPLLLCALLAAGCTGGFFYNRLDTFAGWYFESLVSLNDGQRTELREWLSRTLVWHRNSELNRYAAFLSDVSAAAERPGTRDTYDAMRVRFQSLLHDLIAKTAPEASQLLTHLSPQQVDEFLDNLAEKSRKNAAEAAESVAANEWRPEQTQDIAKQLKRWTGAATAAQKKIIESHVADLEPTYADWAESQQAWRTALRTALLSDTGQSEGAPSRIVQLLEDPDQQWTAAYSQKVARNREHYLQMIMELDATLSSQQRAHLRAELLKLSQQLTRLSRS